MLSSALFVDVVAIARNQKEWLLPSSKGFWHRLILKYVMSQDSDQLDTSDRSTTCYQQQQTDCPLLTLLVDPTSRMLIHLKTGNPCHYYGTTLQLQKQVMVPFVRVVVKNRTLVQRKLAKIPNIISRQLEKMNAAVQTGRGRHHHRNQVKGIR